MALLVASKYLGTWTVQIHNKDIENWPSADKTSTNTYFYDVMGMITPMAQNFATPVSSRMMFLFGTDHNQILELASTKVARQMADMGRKSAGRGFCSRYLPFSVIFSDFLWVAVICSVLWGCWICWIFIIKKWWNKLLCARNWMGKSISTKRFGAVWKKW